MTDQHDLIEEASTLGWPPGHWPASFTRDGEVWRRGAAHYDGDNDIVSVRYLASTSSRVMVVLND